MNFYKWHLKSTRPKRRRVLPPLDPYCPWWRTRTFDSRKSMERFRAKYPDNAYEEIFVNNAYGVLYIRKVIIDIE